MKKILFFACATLLAAGITSCNSKQGGSNASSPLTDSLSMVFGDLYGNGMGGQIKMMDSTMNMNEVFKGIQATASSDTSNKAYMAGMQMGMQVLNLMQGLKEQYGINLNADVFMQHLKTALTNNKPMSQDQMMALQAGIEPLLKRATAEARAKDPVAIENKKKGEEYLNKLKADKDYTTTASGLTYKVLAAGQGENFKDGDRILVKYTGKHLDGTEFDSSKDKPVPFDLNRVVPGFAEMLKLMKPGSKVIAVLPADIAYGAEGNHGIAPNETLIFEMEAVGLDTADKKPGGPRPIKPAPAPAPRPAK